MPGEFEILEPEETLYQASRFWTHAANEWEAAVEWLPEAVLTVDALGLAYHPDSATYVRAYNDCVWDIRAKLAEGAENLHDAAKALRLSAEDYVEIDAELTARVDSLRDLEEGAPASDPDRWHGAPGPYHWDRREP